MNLCAPDFDIHDDYNFPSSSSFRSLKSSRQEEEVMELLWQNGQVVMQRTNRPQAVAKVDGGGGSASEFKELFIKEDEMASWLHYPLDDDDFCADLLFPTAAASCADTAVTDPVQEERSIPPATRRIDEDFRAHGFGHFSRFRQRQEVSATVVESNATPVAAAAAPAPESRASQAVVKTGFVGGSSFVGAGGVETTSLDFTLESSSGASGAEPGFKPPASDDKKRKGREGDEIECHSQDVILKATDAKKQVHGSTAKRTRAAEVHNLSERRRRDRINEKMKALQELIPRCNKSDKASMLDDAIEYLKSLQMQVQMMSMGCGMVPMMFPGMLQYMQPIGMGMGMGVDVNRSMMPFPMAPPTHLGPRFPLPAYHPIPPFMSPYSSKIQVNNQRSVCNPAGTQNPYQKQVPTIPDQYQQYLGSQTMQMQPPQNDTVTQPISKPIPSGGPENLGGGPENLEPRPYLAEISC